MNTESNPYLLINCVATIGVCVFRVRLLLRSHPFLFQGDTAINTMDEITSYIQNNIVCERICVLASTKKYYET